MTTKNGGIALNVRNQKWDSYYRQVTWRRKNLKTAEGSASSEIKEELQEEAGATGSDDPPGLAELEPLPMTDAERKALKKAQSPKPPPPPPLPSPPTAEAAAKVVVE